MRKQLTQLGSPETDSDLGLGWRCSLGMDTSYRRRAGIGRTPVTIVTERTIMLVLDHAWATPVANALELSPNDQLTLHLLGLT